MKWEKMSPEAAERLAALVRPFKCDKKPMFGHEVYWINGNMFAGIFASSTWIRLSKEDQAKFLARYPDAKLFEPVAGRPMKDYLVVPEVVLDDPTAAREWLEIAYRYTASMPPKKAKTKK